VAATGLLVAIFFSILYDNPGNFIGIAIVVTAPPM
jgi:hypothetical protein